MLINNSVI